MKKLFAMLLALVMALTLVACGEQGGNDPQDGATGDKVIKIGVFEPQSGDNGAGGKQEILGMQYANKMFPPSPWAARSIRSSWCMPTMHRPTIRRPPPHRP